MDFGSIQLRFSLLVKIGFLNLLGRLSYKCVIVLKQDRVNESNIEAS